MINPSSSLSTLQARRLAVSLALNFTPTPYLQPSPYKQLLLDAFVRGDLTMDQVMVHLEAHEYERERKPPTYFA